MAYEVVQPLHLVGLAFFLVLSHAFSHSVFRPLRKIGNRPIPQIQYRLSELLILAGQLSVIGLLTFEPLPEEGISRELAGLSMLWFLLGCWWWFGIRLLSKAGVKDNFRRAIFLLFVIPCTYGWSLIAVSFNPIVIVVLLLPLLLGALILFVLLRVCEKVVSWIAHDSPDLVRTGGLTGRAARKCGAVLLCVCLGFTTIYLISWPVRTGDWFFYKSVARRTYREMKTRADIAEIQSWLSSVPDDQRDSNAQLNWPSCIRSLSPGYIYFDQERCVRLGWGSGFGHWGLCVGPATMQTPASDDREYRIPLEKGAYVWHELQ